MPFVVAVLALALAGCRGPVSDAPAGEAALAATVADLVPKVEKAVGISFRSPPKYALRTKDQVRAFVLEKLEQQYPPAKVEGISAAYRLLELIPDTLDLKALLLSLYAEQVAGYYDPDSTTLYAVEGADDAQQRLVLAHELVHALQHERLPLDSLLKDVTNSDRLVAGQAVLEGHAVVAMLEVMMVDQAGGAAAADEILDDPAIWQQYREGVKAAQTTMPVFGSAPTVLREGLIFPYLGGAEFIRWWAGQPGTGPLPTRDQLPQSTEQVIHPARYLKRDLPVPVAFVDGSEDVLHEDTMGELELQIWATELRGGGEVLAELPLGWGGDRFRVYRSADGPALVHYTVWDDSTSARRFATLAGTRFVARARRGYRTEVVQLEVGGRPAVRVVRAPEGWTRWNRLPEPRVDGPAAPGAAPPTG
jgi:hypothetical protein